MDVEAIMDTLMEILAVVLLIGGWIYSKSRKRQKRAARSSRPAQPMRMDTRSRVPRGDVPSARPLHPYAPRAPRPAVPPKPEAWELDEEPLMETVPQSRPVSPTFPQPAAPMMAESAAELVPESREGESLPGAAEGPRPEERLQVPGVLMPDPVAARGWSREKLTEAILMAEIIGPPLARRMHR